ncbi:MAG: hypothetical protein K2N79_03265 [Muribaculaceae bacterium]|nr:hypothetical protein [Muribaculaceae bacterium]MDE7370039.1 hypothetical protein [Muribaculaceae bacterium]
MDKLVKRIILIFSMMFVFSFSMDAQTTIDFVYEDSDDDYIEIPDEMRPRSIYHKMTGYIDLETQSIVLPEEVSESVLFYELWIDNTCLLQTIDESEFVAKLSNIKAQFVTIIITTQNHLLTGVYAPQN